MPEFIFILHADGWIDHEESVDLPDLSTARVIALEAARELVHGRCLPKGAAKQIVVEIFASGGAELSRIVLADAAEPNAFLDRNDSRPYCHWHL